jgi:AcrR family transcriptional regulator
LSRPNDRLGQTSKRLDQGKGNILPKAGSKPSAFAPEEGLRSRQAILSAALTAFARDGYDGASMPKIGRMAQVAPPLIHYYFGSKENLWRETVEHSLGALRREAAAVLSATRALAPLDRLRALLQAITRFAAHWPDHFVMIVADARSETGRFAWVQDNYTGPLFSEIVAILRDARDQGAIDDANLEQLALMLVGGILLHFSLRPDLFEGQDIDAVAEQFTELMFRMFLHGVARRNAKP